MNLEQKRNQLETLDWMDEMSYFSAELTTVGLNGCIKVLIGWKKIILLHARPWFGKIIKNLTRSQVSLVSGNFDLPVCCCRAGEKLILNSKKRFLH